MAERETELEVVVSPAATVVEREGITHYAERGVPHREAFHRELEAAGTEVLSCGTCLEFFDRRDALGVGSVSNMYATVETLTVLE